MSPDHTEYPGKAPGRSPPLETYVPSGEFISRTGVTPYVRAGNLPAILPL
jgi:hypothetical protein